MLVIGGGIPDKPRRFALLLRSEKDYPARLRRLARSLAVEKRVLFTDYVPEANVPELLAMASIVVLPYQGNPTQSDALYKALSCGTPIIATRHQGFQEVLEEGKDSLLFPPKDVTALGNALDDLLADSSKALEMGKSARSKVERRYDLSNLADRMIEVYTSAIENGGLVGDKIRAR